MQAWHEKFSHEEEKMTWRFGSEKRMRQAGGQFCTCKCETVIEKANGHMSGVQSK